MSKRSNPFSQGGGGTHFEFETHTAFFTLFLLGSPLPFAEDEKIVRYRQQSGSLGYETDDLLLWTSDPLNVEHRNLLQIKHGLVTGETPKFEELLVRMWKDFSNRSLFDKGKDRLIVVKDGLSKGERNHLQKISDWARVKVDAADFTNEVFLIAEKKKYYDLFLRIWNKAGIHPGFLEIYDFFKCFHLIEYDFANLNSIDRSSILNLTNLAKAPGNRLHASEIWSNIFKFVSSTDAKAGSFDWNGIPSSITAYFNQSYYPSVQQQLNALTNESREIVDIINTDIGSVTLDRSGLLDNARELIASKQILIITGEAGAGKSALAKILLKEFTGHLIALKADELARGNIVDLLKGKGISLTITEFFNHFPLDARHIIYVDALEKLLEGEGDAFRQLIKVLNDHPDLRLIASSRKRNFNLLEIKFLSGIPFAKIDIGFLSTSELNQIAERLPDLKKVLANPRLAALVKVPKYLDLVFRAIKISGKEFSATTESEFVQDLWDIIIENKINWDSNGMPSRRRESFIGAAVLRAKRMTPFVTISNPDHEALHLLEHENVVVRSKTNQYAPAHDVLEDWALVRYIESCVREFSDAPTFFSHLGNEPAMRRAFRLWVQEAFATKTTVSISFISSIILGNISDRFWQDESLIALLQSDFTEEFLAQHDASLMNNNWKLFARFLHILRTACRENEQSSWINRYYVPTGPGWHAFIKYIHAHETVIPERFYPLVLSLLEDYSKLNYDGRLQPAASREAGLISLFLLAFFRSKVTYDYDDKIVLQCLTLSFEFAQGVTTELEQILDVAISKDDEPETPATWIEVRYHQKILTVALEGLSTGQLPNVFPDKLIHIASKRWRYARKTLPAGSYGFSSLTPDEEIFIEFGLNEDEKSFEAPSAYTTFLYKLLRYHPEKAIDFIVNFINTCTITYLANNPLDADTPSLFDIVLPDGSLRTIKGYAHFWNAYRGYTGVPKLIEAILMALERYLIELGNQGTPCESLFIQLLERLYSSNRSLFISGLLASVGQAHPGMARQWALPPLTNKAFVLLDLQRFAQDLMMDRSGSNDAFHKERMEARRWPHRQRFLQGLKALATEPVLYYEGLGERIFHIIDKHREKADQGDLDWKRHLDDMDYRTYRLSGSTITEDGRELAYFTSTHDEDVSKKMEEDKKNPPFDLSAAGESNWMMSVFNGSKKFELEQWTKIYDRYMGLAKFSWHEHSPATLAAIGLRNGWDNLNEVQKNWCATTVFESFKLVKNYYQDQFKLGVFDKKAVVAALPLLLVRQARNLNADEVSEMVFEWLQLPAGHDPDYGTFLHSFHHHVWKANPAIAKAWWAGVIHLAALKKQFRTGDGKAKFEDLLARIKKGNTSIDIEKISITTHHPTLLARAADMLPSTDIDGDGLIYLVKALELYYQYDIKQNRFNRDDDQFIVETGLKNSIQLRIPSVIAHASYDKGERLLDAILGHVTAPEFLENASRVGGNSFAFFNALFKQVFYEVGSNNDKEISDRKELYANFYQLWVHFDQYLANKKTAIFSQYLLLEGNWYEGELSWEPIADMKDFLVDMIVKYGASNLNTVISLLTYPANKMLMPEGISVLSDLIKNSGKPTIVVDNQKLEKFVHRTYDKYYETLLGNPQLLKDLLLLLDYLVDNGSSDAYWIREYLITFQQPALPGASV